MEEKKKAATGTKPGRKPASEKTKAQNVVPVVYVQYQEAEAEVDALVEAAKADFKANRKRTRITELKLYIKPEERAAYYVVNGNENFTGKIAF